MAAATSCTVSLSALFKCSKHWPMDHCDGAGCQLNCAWLKFLVNPAACVRMCSSWLITSRSSSLRSADRAAASGSGMVPPCLYRFDVQPGATIAASAYRTAPLRTKRLAGVSQQILHLRAQNDVPRCMDRWDQLRISNCKECSKTNAACLKLWILCLHLVLHALRQLFNLLSLLHHIERQQVLVSFVHLLFQFCRKLEQLVGIVLDLVLSLLI